MKHFILFTLILIISGCTTLREDPFTPAQAMPSAILKNDTIVTRIALGSCFNTALGDQIFSTIRSRNPDAFLFIGDNVYAEDEKDDPALISLRNAYGALSELSEFAALRNEVPLLVAWDDHDYGLNDAGGDWPHRFFSESLYEHVWAIDDERTERAGTYFSRIVGAGEQRVQFIVLDTRFFRTPLTDNPDRDQGRYLPSEDPDQNLLGDEQWQWLEEQLSEPADIRILATTIQLIADGHYWEAWRMMPKERDRLYQLLQKTDAQGVVVVSGDRHAGSIYRNDDVLDYPLYELTASSLNVPLTRFVKDPKIEPGPHRLGDPYFEANFGQIDINWQSGQIALKLIDENDHTVKEQIIPLSVLR